MLCAGHGGLYTAAAEVVKLPFVVKLASKKHQLMKMEFRFPIVATDGQGNFLGVKRARRVPFAGRAPTNGSAGIERFVRCSTFVPEAQRAPVGALCGLSADYLPGISIRRLLP